MTALVTNCKPTHAAYADESSHNKGRFRGIGVVTLSIEDAAILTTKLRSYLTVSELKWSELRNPRVEVVARDFIKTAVHFAWTGHLRIDVLTWDTHDSRHQIPRRDDSENLRRMYYHLLHNVFRLRWPSSCMWRVYPDENTALNSETLLSCLDSKSYRIETRRSIISHFDSIQILRQYGICEIRQSQSHQEPLIQLADLFVGLGVYSREHADSFTQWSAGSEKAAQPSSDVPPRTRYSYSELHRYHVLQAFHDQCKTHNLQVDLDRTRGLKTLAPNNAVNFWQYQPQRQNDKAPTKLRQLPLAPPKTGTTDLDEAC